MVFGESQEPGTGVAHPDPSECCTTLSFIRLGQWTATTVPTASSSTPQELRTAFLPGSVCPSRALGAGASFRMSAQIIVVFNWLDPNRALKKRGSPRGPLRREALVRHRRAARFSLANR